MRVRSGCRSAALGALAAWALSVLSGCTVSEWESAKDADRTTTTVNYAKDTRGVRRSLIDHLSRPAENFNEWSPSRDEATCAANRLLDRFGLEGFLDAGFEPSDGSLQLDWTPEDKNAAVNILVGCIDFEAGMVELLSGYDKVSVEIAACMARGGERRQLPRLLAASLVDAEAGDPFGGEGELARDLASLTQECLGPDDLQPAAPLPPLPADQRNTTTTTSR